MNDPRTRLSEHFTLGELTTSEFAARNGIDNDPPEPALTNLYKLCRYILQPLRETLGKPLIITSGYRSPEVNAGIGGAKTSQHIHGEAADINCPSMTVEDLFLEIEASGLPYDQLIQEFDQWVHVSFTDTRPPRREMLYAKKVNGKTEYSKA